MEMVCYRERERERELPTTKNSDQLVILLHVAIIEIIDMTPPTSKTSFDGGEGFCVSHSSGD